MVFFRTLKSGLRHLLSQKLNSSLHIVGLSLGMTVCLLIGLFIKYELSFDTYHPNASRTYRINEVFTDNDGRHVGYGTQFPLAETLRKTVSGLDHVVFAQPVFSNIIDVNSDKRFQQRYMLITDSEFLNVFDVQVVKGKGHETLRTPYSALITESTATNFFGSEDPIGKTFTLQSKFEITVGGVIRDMPANTHLPVTVLLSYVPDENFLHVGPNTWEYTAGNQTYVVLPEGYNQDILVSQLNKIADDHINSIPDTPKFLKTSFELLPLADIHFNLESGGSEWIAAFNPTWLWFFGAIATSVLILACINFVNLSTAQALTRAKEVGVRKSVGAGRGNLLMQFLGEAWILAVASGILAIGATQFTLPYVNTLLETNIQFELMSSPELLLVLFAGILLVGLLAGVYPAFVITRFNPAVSLRSGFNQQGESVTSWLKRSLVVVQFTMSAGMLIALVLMSRQVDFIRSMSLGFDKTNMIVARTGGRGESQVLGNELNKIPAVEGWSFSTAAPSSTEHWGTIISNTDRNDPNRQRVITILGNENYGNLYGFKLLAGRFPIASDTNFISNRLPADKMLMKAAVNEKLIKALQLGTPEEAIGKHFWFGMGNGDIEIVGVVADFNARSAHEPIQPTLIGQMPGGYNTINVKVRQGSDMPATIAAIEAAWKLAYPDGVFSYNFLNDQIDNFYKAETRIYALFRVFSGMAMLISCLGLWGLITFTAQRRLKEIGIRKVLGATASSIMVLLSREFMIMVLISLMIATPLVYYGVSEWLGSFAFRIPIGWDAFVIAGIISLALALITVGIQALRATFTNPARILKSE
ncbi:MAG TPA: ABC transporter permease [Cyclobacteriaceae bacterium]|nr:ABC transporter permease [Cyclobacteriaceae bacterium]